MFIIFEWIAKNVPPGLIAVLFAVAAVGMFGRYAYCNYAIVANGRYKFGAISAGMGMLLFGSNYLWIQLGATPTLVQSGIFRLSALIMSASIIHMNAAIFEVMMAKIRQRLSDQAKGKHKWTLTP